MASSPNVLMILADRHHAGLMGCEGHAQAITPRLDALAQQGTRFTRAYCKNPICTPSCMSILSRQYCHNHGYFGLGGPVPNGLSSLFGHFRSYGDRTADGRLTRTSQPAERVNERRWPNYM
ncbi:MAG: sulfatase-like hydrolase/transferase [Planctomycetota bacterium]